MDFAAGLDQDLLLCPVRALCEYIWKMSECIVSGIATSTAFHKNWSIASVLDAASRRSNSIFASFYLKNLQFEYEGIHSLGPFGAAGEHIG